MDVRFLTIGVLLLLGGFAWLNQWAADSRVQPAAASSSSSVDSPEWPESIPDERIVRDADVLRESLRQPPGLYESPGYRRWLRARFVAVQGEIDRRRAALVAQRSADRRPK